MKKLLLVVMLSGCGLFGGTPRPPTTTPSEPPPPLPAGPVIVVKIGNVEGNEAELLTLGVESANRVLQSPCFRDTLLNKRLTSTWGRSNRAVYESLTSPQVHLEVSFFMGTKKQNYRYKTVGYFTDPNKVFMNRFFVTTADDIADNLIHEAAHARGYIHRSARQFSSVPYTMNALFTACADGVGIKNLRFNAEAGSAPYHPEEE